jgi:hypothetical protein
MSRRGGELVRGDGRITVPQLDFAVQQRKPAHVGTGSTGLGQQRQRPVRTARLPGVLCRVERAQPAAPGYSRISVAAKAMYSYINDRGGYNPTRTVEVVKKLVLQDQVFAIVGGLGTPTHSKVIDYLNTESVPDLLVSSGALMWDDPGRRQTFGFQVDHTREGKIQGKYLADKLPGKKVGLLFQNDDVGRDAQKGLDQFLAGQIVTRQGYDPGPIPMCCRKSRPCGRQARRSWCARVFRRSPR